MLPITVILFILIWGVIKAKRFQLSLILSLISKAVLNILESWMIRFLNPFLCTNIMSEKISQSLIMKVSSRRYKTMKKMWLTFQLLDRVNKDHQEIRIKIRYQSLQIFQIIGHMTLKIYSVCTWMSIKESNQFCLIIRKWTFHLC